MGRSFVRLYFSVCALSHVKLSFRMKLPVHYNVVCPFTVHLSLVLLAITYGGMARLSSSVWLVVLV